MTNSPAVSSKVVLIAPYPELGDIAREISRELGIDIEVLVGVLRIGVKIAQEMEARGVEVVITRGGTIIESLESGVKIPVVQIEVTGYDILRALYEARKVSENIGLIDYENMVALSNSDIIEDLLRARIYRSVIYHHKELEGKIRELGATGAEVIVGGGQVVKTCEALGIPNVLICSERESIRHAMLNAMAVLEARRLEREKTNRLRAIVSFAYEGIVAVDSKARITTFNSAASRLTGVRPEEALGRCAEDIFPGIGLEGVLKSGVPQLDSIYRIRDSHIACNKVPIKTVGDEIAGVVLTFQDVTKIQQLERKIRKELAARGHIAKYSFKNIIGQSQRLNEAIGIARRYSEVDSTVLITGETGTGKELFAQGIHSASRRRAGPFVAVNCAALPETLLESELFGYVEGAFTDARRGGKAGLIELAHGGTLFLDEIGEVSTKIQARLLRVLQEKEVMRVGDDKVIPVDIRVIAATNRELWPSVERGEFREDLYYRLNVLTLRVPPLRERREDIPLLLDYFLEHFCRRHGRSRMSLSKSSFRKLTEYDWPGNVRELMNVLERLVVLSDSPVIREELVESILSGSRGVYGPETVGKPGGGGILSTMKKEVVLEVLRQENFHRARAARRLGISTTTLWRWLKEIGVS